jgi:hypothetical protein
VTGYNIYLRVRQYLDRSDLQAHIPNWINDTRVDIALKYNFKYLYTEASASCVAGTKKYALPSDYLGHLVVWCANKKLMKLDPREADELTKTDSAQTAYPRELPVENNSTIDATTTIGPPDYYIERGMEIEMYPTPSSTYTITVSYYQQPTSWANTSITASDGSAYDYMSTFHFEAIIWGTCLRGAMFLDDDENTAKFQALYDRSLAEMVKREQDMKHEDTHPRMKSWKDFDLTTFKRGMRIAV